MTFSVGETARELKCSASNVVRLNRLGRLPATRDSKNHRRFNPDDVERFKAELSALAAARRLGLNPASRCDAPAKEPAGTHAD
jgi:excisionase family DNA binding protein